MTPVTFSNQVAIAIFYPLAVGIIFSFLSVWLSGRTADRNAQRQNDLAAKMKLADFRQAWINDLRDCLSQLQSRGLASKHNPKELQELCRLALKIRFLMNKKDADYGRLDNLIGLLIESTDQRD